MSILSEILSTGHVDKELLDALDDEQKQLLFCQMRAEQIRKWEAYEDRLATEPPQRKDMSKKRLRWLVGNDGDVWVWVMGEHEADPSIDQILDEEARHEAHIRALTELTVPNAQDASSCAFIETLPPEEALKAQLGSMRVGITDSMYDDADTVLDHDHPLLFQPGRFRDSNDKPVRNIPISTTVSSYSTPQPQRTEMKPASTNIKPTILPKPVSTFIPSSVEKSWQNVASDNGVKMRTSRNLDEKEKLEEVQKRESEIFQSLQEQREKIRKEAEAEENRRRQEWEIQNKRAREAENAMREMAQKAREQHRKLIRTSTSILPALKDTKATSLREALKNLPRPPKPKSRQAIIEWFRKDELSRGTGLDPKTKAPAPWFHGIITRDQAEVLLQDKPKGSFLVRVSERIWGYTVSYVVGDGSHKHFLIERIAEGYQFLGTNQVVHEQLFDLVAYHETAPITAKGGEVLIWSVGQLKGAQPDYYDIMPEYLNQPASNRNQGCARGPDKPIRSVFLAAG